MQFPFHSFSLHMVLLLAASLILPARAGAHPVPNGGLHFKVQAPGTLAALVGDDRKKTLTDITVEGTLNGSDLRFLREMAGSDYHQQPTEGRLRTLDLSRATFTPGGEAYVYKDEKQSIEGGALTLPPFAFRSCRLEQVVLPERMDTIGIGAFEYSALRSIRIPEQSVVMEWAFNRCGSLVEVEFPQHMVELGQNCFRNCGSLRSIRIHSVQFLPYLAFQNVTGLEEVVIDGTLWHADGWICDACPNLKRITFSGTVFTTGGLPIASNCPKLQDITFSGFCLPMRYGSVENCPMVGKCHVSGCVLESGNHDFIPFANDVSDISELLLRRATDAVRAMKDQEKLSKYAIHKIPVIRTMASTLAKRGMKEEALQMLDLLYEIGFPYYEQIASDTAFTCLQTEPAFVQLMEKMQKNSDFLQIIRQSPPYDTGAAYRQSAPVPRLTYATSDDSMLQRIRNYFQTDYIAGSGTEIERLKNVMFWVHNRIRHRGNFIPQTRRTAIDLVEGCWQTGHDGMNARGQAIVLAEIYQALGWPARFITCQSFFYADDSDATVVTAVWSFSLKKWVMMDASMAAYVTDEDGLLLHPGEIRQRMKDGRPLLLNEEANWNNQKTVTKEQYLDNYMAKNLYYMSGYLKNTPGIESEQNVAYYTLVPQGEKVKIGISTYDDAWFWQSPF